MADDIVVRMRDPELCMCDGENPCVVCVALTEIERLRAAGDALAHLMPHAHLSVPCRPPQGTPLNEWCPECAALAAWKEACNAG